MAGMTLSSGTLSPSASLEELRDKLVSVLPALEKELAAGRDGCRVMIPISRQIAEDIRDNEFFPKALYVAIFARLSRGAASTTCNFVVLSVSLAARALFHVCWKARKHGNPLPHTFMKASLSATIPITMFSFTSRSIVAPDNGHRPQYLLGGGFSLQ